MISSALVALDDAGACVPRRHAARGIEHEDRVVLDARDDELKALLHCAQTIRGIPRVSIIQTCLFLFRPQVMHGLDWLASFRTRALTRLTSYCVSAGGRAASTACGRPRAREGNQDHSRWTGCGGPSARGPQRDKFQGVRLQAAPGAGHNQPTRFHGVIGLEFPRSCGPPGQRRLPRRWRRMGARIRTADWTTTALGPPATWTQGLRSALSQGRTRARSAIVRRSAS